jgi:hypothetical protein
LIPAEFGAAPQVALLPAGRFVYHEVLKVAQQAKANAARTEAEASRPGED